MLRGYFTSNVRFKVNSIVQKKLTFQGSREYLWWKIYEENKLFGVQHYKIIEYLRFAPVLPYTYTEITRKL